MDSIYHKSYLGYCGSGAKGNWEFLSEMKPFGVTLPRDYFVSLKKCSSKHAQFCQPISFYGQKLGGIYYFLLKKELSLTNFFGIITILLC